MNHPRLHKEEKARLPQAGAGGAGGNEEAGAAAGHGPAREGRAAPDSRDIWPSCSRPLLKEGIPQASCLRAPGEGSSPPVQRAALAGRGVSQGQVCPPLWALALLCPRRRVLPGFSPILPSHNALLAPHQPNPRTGSGSWDATSQ